MPAAQMAAAAVEAALNRLLELDPDSHRQLKKLSGRQLKVTLEELPWPMIFHFSDRVNIVIPPKDAQEVSDCSLTLSLTTLQALQDSGQITRLIQQNKLQLDGDIHVAQGFSQLITQLDIDWEEHASHYIGDAMAHNLFNFANRFKQQVNQKIGALATTLSTAAIDEKNIAAPGILVTDFCDQVTLLRSSTERLEARLVNFEKTKLADQSPVKDQN